MTDNGLAQAIRAFQSGDQAAFQSIYDGSSRYIYYTILKSVQNWDIADDILQDTYIEIYRYLPSLKEAEAFKGWASVIAQNKISRYFRKKSEAVFSSEEEMEQVFGSIEEEDIAVLPEDAADNRETQRLIMEIIDRLPDAQREAVVSYYYNQLSIPEIARAMEVPENTVKTWLSRGKKKIKQDVIELAEKHGTKLYSVPFIAVLFGFFSQEAEACALPAGAFYQIRARLSSGLSNMAASTGTAGAPAGIQSVVAGVQDSVAGMMAQPGAEIQSDAAGVQDGVAGMMAQTGTGMQAAAGGVQAGVAGAAGTMGAQAVVAGVAGAAVKTAGIRWGLIAAIVAIVAALGAGTVVGVKMVQSYIEEKELEESQARSKRDRDEDDEDEEDEDEEEAVEEQLEDTKEENRDDLEMRLTPGDEQESIEAEENAKNLSGINVQEVLEEDSPYEIPEVIGKLEKIIGITGSESFAIGDYELYLVMSASPILDKGGYYEVDNVELWFWDSYDFEKYSNGNVFTTLGYEPITLRVRKNAQVFTGLGEGYGWRSAEEIFQKSGNLWSESNGDWYDVKLTFATDTEYLDFDGDGYVIQCRCGVYPGEDKPADSKIF